MNSDAAYLLLAHGSSDPHWIKTFEQMCTEAVAAGDNVFVTYMELGTPLLGDKIKQLHKEGKQQFHIIPLFLAAGKHLRQDIPAVLNALSSELGIACIQHPPIGEHPLIANAIADITAELMDKEQNGN